MKPEIIELPSFVAIGIKIQTSPKSIEIPKLWSEKSSQLAKVPHLIEESSFGIIEPVDIEAGIMAYMMGVAVSEVDEIPDGMSQWDIPAGKYARFEATLPKIGQAFDDFYGGWLPSSDYTRAAGPEFEEYGPEFDPQKPESLLSISIPVVEK